MQLNTNTTDEPNRGKYTVMSFQNCYAILICYETIREF